MNNQWKLVPTEATREILVAMLKANGHVNAYRDAIAAAVPPQDLKPFMYGIMQPDGKPHYSELCVSDEAHHLDDEVDSMNDGEELGYRVVGLYAQPDASEVQRLRAERDALQLRLNEADQRIDELTVLLRHLYQSNNLSVRQDQQVHAALNAPTAHRAVLDPKIIGIERMPPMEYDEPCPTNATGATRT